MGAKALFAVCDSISPWILIKSNQRYYSNIDPDMDISLLDEQACGEFQLRSPYQILNCLSLHETKNTVSFWHVRMKKKKKCQ